MRGEIVSISNVDVSFPFVPYDCQIDYMECVIKALQTKTNAILESPTGTGKTLCLLCAALAWRQTYIAQLQLNALSTESVPGLSSAAGEAAQMTHVIKAPTIIYASRTHSQLSQVVRELKNTVYRPKVSVLGSRESLCLHPKVSAMQNSIQKIHACRAKTKDRSCIHYCNVERKLNDPKLSEILDIEDLVTVTKKLTMCPYYTSRELLRQADVVFMPYNYLIDLKTRKNQSIKLENSVIIFDEAHNIEKVCEEAFSVEITSMDIATCVENCQLALDRVCGEEEGGKEETELTKQDVLIMKALFLSLEREFNKLEVKDKGNVIDKEYFKKLFASIDINDESKEMVTEVLEKMEAVLSLSSNNAILGHTYAVLQKFRQVLDLTLNQTESSKMQYVCYASREQQKSKDNPWSKKKLPTNNIKLSYWCFSPGLAMEDFAKQGIYNIILTSGTLSPLSSFSHELKIPFPISLQNPHVIGPDQLCVQVLTKGSDNTELLSTYQHRSDPKYLISLGVTIVNFIRIIPHGVLIFFPSYSVMNICIEHWKERSTVWQRMEKLKCVFQEPKSKNELPDLMREIDEKLKDPECGGTVLMAVCRGKVSEGIDFSDIHGRGVIITGMPFPPRVDPKVDAKMKFLDTQKKIESVNTLSGDEWYRLQATRAVNQAVGRVIRNSKDYGAVIFLDKRFSYQSNIDQFPNWTKGYVKVNDKFGPVLRQLSQFFKSHQMKEPSTPIPSPEQPPPDTSRLSGMYKEFMNKKGIVKGVLAAPKSPELDKMCTPPPSNKGKHPMKRKSLISLLNNATDNDFQYPANISSPVSSRNPATQENFTTPEIIRNPRKRIRIVAEQSTQPNAKSLFSDGPQNKVNKQENVDPNTNVKFSKTQLYAAELKRRLTLEDYKKFLSIAHKYQKSKDPHELIRSVKELFKNDRDLLTGFKTMLNPEHRDLYQKLVEVD